MAGVEPRFEVYDGDDPLGYVISLNVKRRHLQAGQRAMTADRIANMVVGGKETNSAKLQNCLPVSRAEAAELMSVSERTVASAHAILESGDT